MYVTLLFHKPDCLLTDDSTQVLAAAAANARLVQADVEKVCLLGVKGRRVLLPRLLGSVNALTNFVVELDLQQQQQEQ